MGLITCIRSATRRANLTVTLGGFGMMGVTGAGVVGATVVVALPGVAVSAPRKRVEDGEGGGGRGGLRGGERICW